MFFRYFLFRFDVDFTEIHSFMTRSEAVLQNPEFSISRKEGSVADLYEKVLVRLHNFLFYRNLPFSTNEYLQKYYILSVCLKIRNEMNVCCKGVY